MTDVTEQKDSKDELNLGVVAESDDGETTDQKQDEEGKTSEQDNQDASSELNLEANAEKTKEKLKTMKGQIQSLGEKVRDGDIDQDSYNSTEQWLRTAVEERYPELFNNEVDTVDTKEQIKQELRQEFKAEEDKARFESLQDGLPKDLSTDKKQILQSEYEFLRGKGLLQAESLERAMVTAGINQSNDYKSATERAIRINNGSIPPFGQLSAKPRAEQEQSDEDKDIVKEMAKYGVKLDAKTLKSAREKGII